MSKLIARICAGGSCKTFPNSYCRECSHGLYHGEITYRHLGLLRMTRVEFSGRFGPSRVKKDWELCKQPFICYPQGHPFWRALDRFVKGVESGKIKEAEDEMR